MSEQTRSTDALAAARADLANAARAARNINRLRGNTGQVPRNPVNLDNLIEALVWIHEITGNLGKVVDHYADAVRAPLAGYAGSGTTPEGPADYPRSVADAAANAQQALTELAIRLRSVAVGFSTDAIAGLDIAVAHWRTKNRRAGAHAPTVCDRAWG